MARGAVLEAHGLSRLVVLTCSDLPALRKHATGAIRNLAYKSDANMRKALMRVGGMAGGWHGGS